TSRCGSLATRRLFFGEKSRIQCSAGAGWFAIPGSCLEIVAFNSNRRNALLFLDGEETWRCRDASRGRPRQWREHDLHHYSLSSRHLRRWFALWLWRRPVAYEMRARSRTAFHVQVIGLKNGSARPPKRRGPVLLR